MQNEHSKNTKSNETNDKEKKVNANEYPVENYPEQVFFGRPEDSIFASAMSEEVDFSAEIEISQEISASAKHDIPVQTEPSIQIKDDVQAEINEENSSPVKTILSEEIFEFDLSDPITEPTFFEEGEEAPYSESETTPLNTPGNDSFKTGEKIEDSNPNLIEELEELEILNKESVIEHIVDEKNSELIDELIGTSSLSLIDEASGKTEIPDEIPLEVNLNKTESEPEETLSVTDIDCDIDFEIEIENNTSNENNELGEIIQNGYRPEIEVDISNENVILINNDEEYMKNQNAIMDNKIISFFWPTEGVYLRGSRIAITTEKGKTFVVELDKIDAKLLRALMNSHRPIKVFFDAKPIITWCKINKIEVDYIFDISTAICLLTDGQSFDSSLESMLKNFSGKDINFENPGLQDFVYVGKFLYLLRKSLIKTLGNLNMLKLLNFEHEIIFALAESEATGMPYDQNCVMPNPDDIWELVESKHGISRKEDLPKSGIAFLNQAYLNENKRMLEISEFTALETAQGILQKFDKDLVQDNRIYSHLKHGTLGCITTSDYSFEGEGLYPFISSQKDFCLVEGEFNNLETRVVAKLLNNKALINSFSAPEGPYAYFAAPMFSKPIEQITLEEKFKAKMILEIVIRNYAERETLFHAWDVSKTSLKEEEILELKERFKKSHPDLINLIKNTQKQAKKDGYITSPAGRISAVAHPAKAFYAKIEMAMNEIFKRALALTYIDLALYNSEFANKIRLCTIYNRIITLECNKKIVNIAIDILTRNLTISSSKMLKGIPVLLKIHAAEQWEA